MKNLVILLMTVAFVSGLSGCSKSSSSSASAAAPAPAAATVTGVATPSKVAVVTAK